MKTVAVMRLELDEGFHGDGSCSMGGAEASLCNDACSTGIIRAGSR